MFGNVPPAQQRLSIELGSANGAAAAGAHASPVAAPPSLPLSTAAPPGHDSPAAAASSPLPPPALAQSQQQPRRAAPANVPTPAHAPLAAAARSEYESLDYDVAENAVYRAERAAAGHVDAILKGGAKWSMCLALGLITAAASFAVNVAVESISGLKFRAALALLASGRPAAAFALHASFGACLVAVAAALTVGLAPAAAGSGIAEVKAYLNGVDVPGIFDPPTLLVKLVGSVLAVAGGLAVGKEGPFVHAGAAVGALLSQGGPAGAAPAWFRANFWNARDRADMVAVGTAAGIAAAFRAPLGGLLFALEEATTWWRNQLLWYGFFTTAVVSVAVRAFARTCPAGLGCGVFGAGGGAVTMYQVTPAASASPSSALAGLTDGGVELLPLVLIGVAGGLLGSAFNHLNARLAAWRRRNLAPRGPRARVAEAAAMSALTSAVAFALPLLAGCRACPPGSSDTCPRPAADSAGAFVPLGCAGPEPGYSDLGTLFFNTQDDAIRNLFSGRVRGEYSAGALAAFTPAFFGLALLSYGLALPTGLFVPGILVGAAYGRLVGVLVAGARGGGLADVDVDEGAYALLGAASFLGGSMRLTVCTCVMLLELTNSLGRLPMMMLVLLIAKAVGDGTGVKPIYESLIDAKRLPWLEPAPNALMRHVTAAEACGAPAVALARVERVGRLMDVLRGTTHGAFPVVDGGGGNGGSGNGAIMGLISRRALVVLLSSRRALQPSPLASEAAGRVAMSYRTADFAAPLTPAGGGAAGGGGSSSSGVTAAGGVAAGALPRLPAGAEAMYVDLTPYVNPSYFAVQEDASLAKVYAMFRALGLRHLAVIPRAGEVRGIITRSDLLSGQLARRVAAAGAAAPGAAAMLGEELPLLGPGVGGEHCRGDDGGGGGGESGGSYYSSYNQQQQQQQPQRGYQHPAATARRVHFHDSAAWGDDWDDDGVGAGGGGGGACNNNGSSSGAYQYNNNNDGLLGASMMSRVRRAPSGSAAAAQQQQIALRISSSGSIGGIGSFTGGGGGQQQQRR